VIVQPNFLDHWKTYKLIDLLGDPCAPLYVIRIWAHCQNQRTDVLPQKPDDLRSICKCDVEAKKLKESLISCGFIDEHKKNIVAHGWRDVNKRLFSNRENGKRGGRPHNEPNNNPSVNDGIPNQNPKRTRSKGIRVDKSRVDIPPVVPPGDGREGDDFHRALIQAEALSGITYRQDLEARRAAGFSVKDPRLGELVEAATRDAMLMGELDHPAMWWRRFLERSRSDSSTGFPQKKEGPAPRHCDPAAEEVL
jgi:hypothetical protein